MKTLQEIFDTVVNHLVTQNGKSTDTIGDCRYRGIDGKMCAVGCLIGDEFYTESLESKGVSSSIVLNALTSSIGNFVKGVQTQRLLIDLQNLHDSHYENDYDFKLYVDKIAGLYNLENKFTLSPS